jgi:hypothetical protein
VRLFTQEEDIHEMEDKKKYPLLHKHDVISCLGMSGKWITSQNDLQVWLKNTTGQGLVSCKYQLSSALRKESFNSDGQQFHQYQQNEQSPQLIEHQYDHYIQRWKSSSWLGTGTKNVVGLNRLMVYRLYLPNTWQLYSHNKYTIFISMTTVVLLS